jgi:hypothetical protein
MHRLHGFIRISGDQRERQQLCTLGGAAVPLRGKDHKALRQSRFGSVKGVVQAKRMLGKVVSNSVRIAGVLRREWAMLPLLVSGLVSADELASRSIRI